MRGEASSAPGLGRTTPRFGLRECVEVKNVTWTRPAAATSAAALHRTSSARRSAPPRALLAYGGATSRVKVLREGGGSLLRTGAKTLRR